MSCLFWRRHVAPNHHPYSCFLLFPGKQALPTSAAGSVPQIGMLMPQVLLFPCVHDSDPDWKGGRGPQCDDAPFVEVTCWPRTKDSDHNGRPSDLRMPEHWFNLSDAAMRAFRSLDLVPSLDSLMPSVVLELLEA